MESKNVEQTIEKIDRCLLNISVVYVSPDLRAMLEGDVWSELDHWVQQGWYTAQEAQDMFMEWRAKYLGDV